MGLEHIYRPIASDMQGVKACLAASLAASSDPEVRRLCNGLQGLHGKMLRPALVCLCARIAGRSETSRWERDMISAAAAMELVHLASLIHDDIVDHTLRRRGQPSVKARFGDEISLLLGDLVYTQALRLISRCKHRGVFVRVCDAIHDMCEGELSQVRRRGRWDLSREDTIAVIRKKTASLFAVSCGLGVMVGRGSDDLDQVLTEFGMQLGTAYQIADDVRDVCEEEHTLGKPPQQDVYTGDVTLPLMDLREAAEKSGYRGQVICQDRETSPMAWLQAQRMDQTVLKVSRDAVRSHGQAAVNLLERIAPSAFKVTLIEITGYIIDGVISV